jgi:hypothetical protein
VTETLTRRQYTVLKTLYSRGKMTADDIGVRSDVLWRLEERGLVARDSSLGRGREKWFIHQAGRVVVDDHEQAREPWRVVAGGQEWQKRTRREAYIRVSRERGFHDVTVYRWVDGDWRVYAELDQVCLSCGGRIHWEGDLGCCSRCGDEWQNEEA